MKARREVRLGSYKSYLLFKNIIGVIRKNPSTRRQMAEALGLDVENVWNVVRVLVKGEIIKLVSYDISTGGKQGVYKLVKDD